MKSQPTYKVCRRLGPGVFDKCQTQKFALSEARHAKNVRGGRRRNVSDYGKQLLEKQKVCFAYHVSERQLRRYVQEAQRAALLGVPPITRMIEQLEMRIDNIVYRLGFAPTRRAARQLVSHGHLLVNGTRTTIPSYEMKVGDVITVRERTSALPVMERIKAGVQEATMPKWMSFDMKKNKASILAKPSAEQIEMPGDVGAILEFYSR